MKVERPSEEFSYKATVLSFVMAISVVFIHANNLSYYGLSEAEETFAFQITKLCGSIIGGMAVPFFFFMSGYWFFRNIDTENHTWKTVFNKCRKRIKTLVIPYLLWNTFGTVFYMVITNIPILASEKNYNEPIEVNLQNILGGVFLHKYYFTFWYMKELILISFCLIWLTTLCIRYKPCLYILILITALMAVLDIELPFMESSYSIFCFLFGAALAVYRREWLENGLKKKYAIMCLVGLVICFTVRFFEIPLASSFALYCCSPLLLLGSFDLISIKSVTGYMKQNFFIYAAHMIPAVTLGHIFAKLSNNYVWAGISYIAAVIITLVFIWIVYKLMDRLFNGFYRLICGGR